MTPKTETPARHHRDSLPSPRLNGAWVDVKRPPRIRLCPEGRADTLGDLACEFAAHYGLKADDWQQAIVEDWMATSDAGSRWMALTHGLAVPRQNGKNGCLEIFELYLSIMLNMKILHTAHQVKTAAKHFRRLKYFFGAKTNDPAARYPDLNARVRELRSVNGQEAIFLHDTCKRCSRIQPKCGCGQHHDWQTGGSIEIIARSSASGRGFTVDVIVCDEAQDMTDDDQESLLSTASAAPSGNPLWVYTGTPPGPKSSGEVFTRIRTESIKCLRNPGRRFKRTWIEWSGDENADPPIDPDDQEIWKANNPALGSGRLLWDIVEAERTDLSLAGFCRERLGMWATGGVHQAIPEPSWRSVADTLSVPMDRLALGIEVSHDRSSAGVGLGGRRPNGTWHIELDEQRPGTGWVAEWVANRVRKNRIVAVVIDSSSPAISLVEDLEAEGVKVTQIGTREVAATCGALYDGVVGTVNEDDRLVRTVFHIDQTQLNTSLASSRRKLALNGTAWVWDGKDEESNSVPIKCVTLALWGAQAIKSKRPRSQRTNHTPRPRRASVL